VFFVDAVHDRACRVRLRPCARDTTRADGPSGFGLDSGVITRTVV
jgi:hypothetical protein